MRIEDYLALVIEHLRDKRPDHDGSWCGQPLARVEGLAMTCMECWSADDQWHRQQVLRRMQSER